MHRRTPPLRLAILLPAAALAAVACDGSASWTADNTEAAAGTRADFGPVAAYDRHLIFLGPGQTLPTAAVFDFAALSDVGAIRRGVRARVVDGTDWLDLLDSGWEMEPMREPWRLVPHGPIRMVMSDAGELSTLVYRDDDVVVRLEPGPTIAEHSPDAGTQIRLRQARLRLDGESVPGVLLDAQLGRSLPAGSGLRGATGDTADSIGAGSDPDLGEGAPTPPGDPTPTARPGAAALLLDNSGFYAVFTESAAGDVVWIHTAGRDDVRPDARLEGTDLERFDPAGADVPTRWQITDAGGSLTGELERVAANHAALPHPDLAVIGYVLVSGWIEDRSVRREVYGLVRHVR